MIANLDGERVHLTRSATATSIMPATFFVTAPESGHEYLDLLHAGQVVATVNTIDCHVRLWVERVYVTPEHRGKGHGRQLMEAVFARNPGRTFALACSPLERGRVGRPALSRVELRKWYERLGFSHDAELSDDLAEVLVRAARG
ncbi:GNAT family N-acetyltransferase [Lentzea chajnantorensis]